MLRSETAASPERRAAALAGLAAYQAAPRATLRRVMPARHRRGRARLRDYGGDGAPLLFVPSLINPPYVLDLDSETSLLRWIAAQGFRTWLLDWGAPTPADRAMSVAGHVEQLLLPLIAKLPAPPILIGYCLGGTIALAGAARAPVPGVATIAAPWRFAGYGDPARAAMAALWSAAQPACDTLGLVPMEVLQSAFWQLDPARTIAKYEAFSRLAPDSPQARRFVALEDWANAGAPLTYAAGAELFNTLLARDAPGRGAWSVAGGPVLPADLRCPAIEFVSTTDRIVPAGTAAGLRERCDVAAGHVGMMVGSSGRQAMWTALARWSREVANGKPTPDASH